MTFSRVKALGWALNEILTSAQQNQLDIDHANALDGAAGGSYTPVAVLQIGGSGIRFSGLNHEVPSGGRITVLSGGELRINSGGTFSIQGNSSIGNDAGDVHTWTGTLGTSGGTLSVGGAGTVSVTGTTTIDVASTCSLAVQCPATFSDPVTLSGDGRIRYRTTTPGDSSTTISVATADVYHMTTGVLSAGRNWDISDTGAANGDWMILNNDDTTNLITVRDPALSTIAQLKTATGFSPGCIVVRVGGSWRALLEGKF